MKYLLSLALLVLLGACGGSQKNASEPATAGTDETVVSPSTSSENTAPQTAVAGRVVTLSGKIEGGANQPVQILRVAYNNSKPASVARGQTDQTGAFTIADFRATPGVYALKVGNRLTYFVVDGTEKSVSFRAPLNQLPNFNVAVEGSTATNSYLELMRLAVSKKLTAEQFAKRLEKASPLVASLVALQVFKDPEFAEIHTAIAERLQKEKGLDKSLYATPYQQYATSMLRRAQGPVHVGMKAPDLALPDPNGKIRRLSDLRGKLVLLDFWASWCVPCRRANPEVVRLYHKYKDKGFTVYSVSLDGDRRGSQDPNVREMHKKRWLNAIQKDGLVWPNHVSELKSWNSEAASIYGVTSIPRTFLIGRDGTIKAVNPPHGNLEAVIKKNL